jgi:hypothetical protein
MQKCEAMPAIYSRVMVNAFESTDRGGLTTSRDTVAGSPNGSDCRPKNKVFLGFVDGLNDWIRVRPARNAVLSRGGDSQNEHKEFV